jgi:hypothetical protein
MIFCDLNSTSKEIVESSGVVDQFLKSTANFKLESFGVICLPSLELALELCENALLHRYALKIQQLENKHRGIDIANVPSDVPIQSYLAVSYSPVRREDPQKSILTRSLMSSPTSVDQLDASKALAEAFTNASLDLDAKTHPGNTKGPSSSSLDTQVINLVGDALKRKDVSRGTYPLY